MNMKCLFVILVSTLLTASAASAVEYDHDAHVRELAADGCEKCHVQGAGSITPPQKICLECHDQGFLDKVEMGGLRTHGQAWSLNHAMQARNSAANCSSCHAVNDCLECHVAGNADEMGDLNNHVNNVHRSDFHVTHPLAARTDQQLCARCHEVRFCTDCHATFSNANLAVLSHRRGFTDGTLGGAHATYSETQCQTCHVNSVLPSHEWSSTHSREARKNLATCQACHPEGDVCMKCHSAVSGLRVNPHPQDWGGRMSGRLENATAGKTCRKCH